MNQTLLISTEFKETRVAVVSDRQLVDYHVERLGEKGIFGNIYKGKVEVVIPGIQAAFVNIGIGINGFLYVSEITQRTYEYEDVLEGKKVIADKVDTKKDDISINKLIRKGQDILVQIIREPINTKGPRLTTHISLPGRYVVLMPFDEHVGVSKRIEDPAKRKYLKSIISELKLPKGLGIIVRTFANNATKKEIIAEYRYLLKQWERLEKKNEASKAPSMVHEERNLVIRVMRDMLSDSVDKVFIDSRLEYKASLYFLRRFGSNMRSKLNYYKKAKSIFEDFGVQQEISNIYERKVNLKCGGYILIEPTESLVTVDVNSGGYTGTKDLENTSFFVNMQACEEIIKQIKLRDLGGIIIIDFIDMNRQTHVKQLLNKIKKLLKDDKAETDFWYSPKAGLVEMTRQRLRRSIRSLSYQECHYCDGKGMVKSPATVAIQAIRDIKNMIDKKKTSRLTVRLHPEVVDFLLDKDKTLLDQLRRKNRVRVNLEKVSNFHIEQIEIKN